MFLGHFALALGAKRVAPKVSLGTLVLAAQFADLLWPILLLTGLEQVRIVPGITRVTPLDFVSYPYSHSLLTQLLWGLGIGLVYQAFSHDMRGAVVLGLCVPSHWLLDYIAHRPDMPLVPGGARYGLGLWNSVPATLAVELGLFVIGSTLYLRGTRAKDRTGQYALWSLSGSSSGNLYRLRLRTATAECESARRNWFGYLADDSLGSLGRSAPFNC